MERVSGFKQRGKLVVCRGCGGFQRGIMCWLRLFLFLLIPPTCVYCITAGKVSAGTTARFFLIYSHRVVGASYHRTLEPC